MTGKTPTVVDEGVNCPTEEVFLELAIVNGPFDLGNRLTALCVQVGSCGFVGVFGNLPFGLAPGMGLNAYFAYGVCVAKGVKAGTALAVVFIMGLSFGLLSAVGACAYLQRVMPSNLKHATTVAIGIFQAFLGFRMIKFVVADPHTLVALGDLSSHEVLLGVGTTFFIGVLIVYKVPGAMPDPFSKTVFWSGVIVYVYRL